MLNLHFVSIWDSYITRDELREVTTEHQMGDEADNSNNTKDTTGLIIETSHNNSKPKRHSVKPNYLQDYV